MGDQGVSWHKGNKKRLAQQMRGSRGCSPLYNALARGSDNTSLVQQNSVQLCITMGHEGGVGITAVVY